MKRTTAIASFVALALPSFAFAAFGGISGYIDDIRDLIDNLTVIVAGIALLAFFYGLMKFIFAGANGKIEGKNFMIWGVVALFVMVSVWGLVHFIQDELNITPEEGISIPGFYDR